MSKLLEVKNLKVDFYTYAGVVKAVRGVSFYLNERETLAIVGESGCGKTVTAKAIMQLIPTPPGRIDEKSEILFNGKDISKMSKKDLLELRKTDIRMIFQDPMSSLNPTMRVGDQIAESLVLQGIKRKKSYKKAVEMLKVVNIPNAGRRAKQYPHEYSGGMRQRAMIAMALISNPLILIADEPTTALDVTIQDQIIDLIKELQIKFKMSTIMVTHDLGVVANCADRIQIMYAGMILEQGTTNDIFYSAKHPYTWALLKSVPHLDSKKKIELYSIKGTPPDLIKPLEGCPFAPRCEYRMKICDKVMPDTTNINAKHQVACWLTHQLAPEVNIVSG